MILHTIYNLLQVKMNQRKIPTPCLSILCLTVHKILIHNNLDFLFFAISNNNTVLIWVCGKILIWEREQTQKSKTFTQAVCSKHPSQYSLTHFRYCSYAQTILLGSEPLLPTFWIHTLSVWLPNKVVMIIWINCWFVSNMCDHLTACVSWVDFFSVMYCICRVLCWYKQ